MGRAHEVRAASMAKTAAAKSKLNAKWSKLIYMAAKSGLPDPSVNQALKKEIERAKKEQGTAECIKKAIEKAKGGTGENYESIRYEGFGPEGSMIIVECLTDNTNRTLVAVRTALSRCGFNLGVAGSASYQFHNYAVLAFDNLSEDEALETLLMADVDVQEYETDEDGVVTICAPNTDYSKARDALTDAKPDINFLEDHVTWIPQSYIKFADEKHVNQLHRVIDALNEIDDVQDIYHNVELEEEAEE